jgi:hypothetical protein
MLGALRDPSLSRGAPHAHKQNHTKKHNVPLPNPKLKTQLYAEKHNFFHCLSAVKTHAACALKISVPGQTRILA